MSAKSNLTWQEALDKLKSGNSNFTADKLEGKLKDGERRGQLTGGQNPYCVILSCADSRVVPELAFDTGLGEIFVIRVAGNVANTSTLASIEYAVAHLKTELIVVLGHESCGAVTAAVAGGDNGHNLNHLLAHVAPAVAQSEDKSVNAVVKKNAELTCQQMVERSAILRDAVLEGTLKIVPAYYNLGTGAVDFL